MDNTSIRKTNVVTGATSGIGLAVAWQVAASGADVIGIGRSADRCRQAEDTIRAQAPDINVDYLVADLSLQSEVVKAADGICEILRRDGKTYLDGLVNNAGTFTYWFTLTAEGFETQWAVNYLAPFRMTLELLPLLQAAPAARVVTVSSGSHYGARMHWDDLQMRRCYNGLRAYGQTKLANILFTLELNRRLGTQSSVHAYAADPGLVKTDIGLKGSPGIVRWVWGLRRSGGISPGESASGIVKLLNEPSIQNSSLVYWMHGNPKASSKASLDASAARQLWEISEKMCGFSEERP